MKWLFDEAKREFDISPIRPIFFDITNIYHWVTERAGEENKAFSGNAIPPWKITWSQMKTRYSITCVRTEYMKRGIFYDRVHEIFISNTENYLYPYSIVEDTLNENGAVIGNMEVTPSIIIEDNNVPMDLREKVIGATMSCVNYGFIFSHIKNVTIEDIEPSTKVNKKRKRHNKKLKHSYKRLSIKPMNSYKKGTSSSIQKNRFHIFRGHFKNYTKGNGLFGKLKGIYYWEMGTKGNKKLGTVVKDYDIAEIPEGIII